MQAEIDVAAAFPDQEPALQLVHDVEAINDHVPALQDKHELIAVAPMTIDHVPAKQNVHEAALLADQDPPLQVKHDADPVIENVPALQTVQVSAVILE
jgi:hypothetical protein